MAGHNEITGVPHPGEYLGKLDPEIHGQGDVTAGLHRGGKLNLHKGLVILVAVVRLHITHPVHQVDPFFCGKAVQPHLAEAILRLLVTPQTPAGFLHEGGFFGGKGIRIQVQIQLGYGLASRVFPGYRLGALKQLFIRRKGYGHMILHQAVA
ncbi:hypothetical protein D3C81_1729300 [compost metagenome]